MPDQQTIGRSRTRNQVRVFAPSTPSASANMVKGIRQRCSAFGAMLRHIQLFRSAILLTGFGLIGSPVSLLFIDLGKPQTIGFRTNAPSASRATSPGAPGW